MFWYQAPQSGTKIWATSDTNQQWQKLWWCNFCWTSLQSLNLGGSGHVDLTERSEAIARKAFDAPALVSGFAYCRSEFGISVKLSQPKCFEKDSVEGSSKCSILPLILRIYSESL